MGQDLLLGTYRESGTYQMCKNYKLRYRPTLPGANFLPNLHITLQSLAIGHCGMMEFTFQNLSLSIVCGC